MPEASPKSSLWLGGQPKQDWEVEPPFLPHALSPKGRKGTRICRRQLQHFPTDPMFNELTHQDRKGREITLYTGFPLFDGNLKQTPKPALQSHGGKKKLCDFLKFRLPGSSTFQAIHTDVPSCVLHYRHIRLMQFSQNVNRRTSEQPSWSDKM